MDVLLVSTDLLAGSQLEGAAKAAGMTLRVAGAAKALGAANESAPRLVVIDLGQPVANLTELVAGMKQLEPAPAVVAFGPHVQEQRLQAAAAAGCDEVLTRGQFYRAAAAVLGRYAEAGGSDAPDGETPDADGGSSG